MTPAAYVSKRLARLAAEIRVEMARPTVKNHPDAALGGALWRASNNLDSAVAMLTDERIAATSAPEASDVSAPSSEGKTRFIARLETQMRREGVKVIVADASVPVRFAFIATGRDGFAGPVCYAQDEAGTVWAVGEAAIETAHRFAHREDADRIGSTRGGYAYPIPA